MGLHDLADKRKPQSRAPIMPRGRTVELMEWLEYFLDTIRMNADAGIGHRNQDEVIALLMEGHHHASTGLGEFDSVIDKLIQHPADLFRVCLHMRDLIHSGCDHLYSTFFAFCSGGFYGKRHQAADLDFL